MMSFYDLLPAFRTLLAAFCFIAFASCVCTSFLAYRRRPLLPKILLPVGAITSGIVLVFYAAALRIARQDRPTSETVDAFCELPATPVILLVVLIFAYCSYTIYKEFHYRKTALSSSSIKEGINQISSGLCFYDKSGRIILMNQRMDALCHKIVGRDLQNAALFWEILQGGKTLETVTRLSDGTHPSFRLPDGSVWAFACEELDGIFQLAAGDITGLQAITDQLKEKNTEIAALNERLRQYGENVDELTRSKERLNIKVHIHRELGQTLLRSRQYLQDETGTVSSPLQQWRNQIAMLRKEVEIPNDESPLAMLTRTAKTMGVALVIEGELPETKWLRKLFVQAAAEALVNAINHAEAKTLFIRLSCDENTYTAELRNDGTKPDTKIVEGGGLGSLRKRVESVSGSMTVTHIPEFILTVTLPRERGDIL